MNKHDFVVNNMNCNGCVSTIQQALDADSRIQKIDIKLSKKTVSVEGDISAEEAAELIRNSGYQPELTTPSKGIFGKIFSN
ncbi:MAG: heavy-metal-associated domain-containing protein [Candidatus Marinimicrobia bacterium]|nr:heavy-metal-associated domain-containing protein [Candidatus Neomarinimicrobiota bacterium]